MKTSPTTVPAIDVLGLRKIELQKSCSQALSKSVIAGRMMEIENPSFLTIQFAGFERIGAISLDMIPVASFSPDFMKLLREELNRVATDYRAISLRLEQQLENIDIHYSSIGGTTDSQS